MTTLIIARHGNTFNASDMPTRVGARTDLPLVDSGREQARKLGVYLKVQNLTPEITYSSQLKRTIETAEIALKQTGFPQPVYPLEIFNEIDYGVDENQTEDKVITRIGAQAIKDWDAHGIVPQGWKFNPEDCIQNWKNFAAHIISDAQDVILVVTSNGIARFAPHITGNFQNFAANHNIKLSTGALGILEYVDNQWITKGWNIKP